MLVRIQTKFGDSHAANTRLRIERVSYDSQSITLQTFSTFDLRTRTRGYGQTTTVGARQSNTDSVLELEADLSVFTMGSTLAGGRQLDPTEWPEPVRRSIRCWCLLNTLRPATIMYTCNITEHVCVCVHDSSSSSRFEG